MITVQSDEHFMKQALQEAEKARDLEEVPVGAVIVCKGTIIARAHNLTERLTDVTAHAEMQAITSAAEFLGGKYLNECTLYVTLEPCVMCGGATHLAHMGKIVYGAGDSKRGFSRLGAGVLHPKTEVVSGIMEQECADILTTFFRARR
ncbi:nucleoside deaminase [bacterium SCSIO 12741]|nr:nucleoside deaminase [bacterium SCSIO 12741]